MKKDLANENNYTKLKNSIVSQMKVRDWNAVSIHTWNLYTWGYWDISKRSHKGRRVDHLNPDFKKALKKQTKIIITNPKEKFGGRFIGINIRFPNIYDKHEKNQRTPQDFLYLVYYPADNVKYKAFSNIISSLLIRCPRDNQTIFCHNISCNISISPTREDTFRETMGPHEPNNRNKKGHQLLQFLAFFDIHTTWKNIPQLGKGFNSLKIQHMLDVFSTSRSLFNRVRSCELSKHWIYKSDHNVSSWNEEMYRHLNWTLCQSK